MNGITNGCNHLVLEGPLWENASDTSNFAALTLEIDLSNYKAILLKLKYDVDANNRRYCIILVGETGSPWSKSSNSATYGGRKAQVTTTGITFTTGYRGSSGNTSVCIPLAVYGIKGWPA